MDVFRVGDLVTVMRPVLGNAAGSLAVVYEIYDIGKGPSPSLIFQNGQYDGFSTRDRELFGVTKVGHDAAIAGYHFENVLQLDADFRAGVFDTVWAGIP
jgi:hypothetical protein